MEKAEDRAMTLIAIGGDAATTTTLALAAGWPNRLANESDHLADDSAHLAGDRAGARP